jgi:hypothetical protein
MGRGRLELLEILPSQPADWVKKSLTLCDYITAIFTVRPTAAASNDRR